MEQDKVKESVREHYAGIARRALAGDRSSCCDDSSQDNVCCSSSNVVPQDAITTGRPLPDEIVSTSLGCGTPLEHARLQPGETVLDLGSGGGLDCFQAARLVGAGGHVIGVDMTEEMLALAAVNKQKVGAENVEFRRGHLEQLPLEDASVDVVISNCVINLASDKDRVFQEAFRVLKPGGRIAISDMVSTRPLPDSIRTNLAAWGSCVGGALPESEYTGKMRLAGFTGIRSFADSAHPILVYSAKIVATKPGGESRTPAGWAEPVRSASTGSSCCG